MTHVQSSVALIRPDPPPEPEHVDIGDGTTPDAEVDGRARRIVPADRAQAHDLLADIRVASAAAGEGWPEAEADTAEEGLARSVDIVHRELEDGQAGGSRGTGLAGGARRAVGGRPLGSVRVVLDEERRQIRAEVRSRGQAPADDLAIRTVALAGDRRGQIGSAGAQGLDVSGDGVRRDRPSGQAAPALQRAERRRTDPRAGRELGVEDADQLEKGVTEPDEAVERAERVVTPTATGLQPEPGLQDRCSGIRVRDRDDEMIDTQQHRCSVRVGAARGREAGR